MSIDETFARVAELPTEVADAVSDESAGPYGRAFAIGTVAGMRATFAPLATRLEARDASTLAFALLAVGEIVADKLPNTPSRLRPIGIGARLVSGALCGRALALRFGGSGTTGALAGALGAMTSAFAAKNTRGAIVENTPLPDFVVAVAEDALAATLGIRAQRRPIDPEV